MRTKLPEHLLKLTPLDDLIIDNLNQRLILEVVVYIIEGMGLCDAEVIDKGE
jgi:hypothetical protein